MKYLTLFFALLLNLAATAQAVLLPTDRILLTDLGAGNFPTAINNGGVVVGQSANGVAFLWNAGNLTNLGTLGGSQSYASDINDSGVVVGWSLTEILPAKAGRFEDFVSYGLKSFAHEGVT